MLIGFVNGLAIETVEQAGAKLENLVDPILELMDMWMELVDLNIAKTISRMSIAGRSSKSDKVFELCGKCLNDILKVFLSTN